MEKKNSLKKNGMDSELEQILKVKPFRYNYVSNKLKLNWHS